MTKIYLDLDDDLYKEVKKKAIDLDYKFYEFIPVLLAKGLKYIKDKKLN